MTFGIYSLDLLSVSGCLLSWTSFLKWSSQGEGRLCEDFCRVSGGGPCALCWKWMNYLLITETPLLKGR